VKDLATITTEVERALACLDDLDATLTRACRARSLDRAIDLVYDARNTLCDAQHRVAAILREPAPYTAPDPAMAAQAEIWARRPQHGHLQD
jgi:hypothetical protein